MDARGGSSGCPAAAERAWPAGRAAEPPGTNELRAGKSRPGKMEGSRGEERGGQGGARREKGRRRRRGGKGRREACWRRQLRCLCGRISLWEGSAFGKDQPLRRAAGAAEQGISLCGGRGEAARAARSIFDMEFAFGYIGGESIHEEAMLPLAPSGRPRRGYKQ